MYLFLDKKNTSQNMNINETVTMSNSLRNLNIFKKLGLTILIVMLLVYFALSLKFILS